MARAAAEREMSVLLAPPARGRSHRHAIRKMVDIGHDDGRAGGDAVDNLDPVAKGFAEIRNFIGVIGGIGLIVDMDGFI